MARKRLKVAASAMKNHNAEQFLDSVFLYSFRLENFTDIIPVQFGTVDIQFITHISPKGFQYFIVELLCIVIFHRAGSHFEAFAGHLVGRFILHPDYIGIRFDSPAVQDSTDNEQYERNQ